MVPTVTVPVPSCRECGLQSAGRCPTCHRELCMDHFPCEAHDPCSARMKRRAEEYECYVCGASAAPMQWSSAIFAHYIDSHRCAGCNRPICDESHTKLVSEDVVIHRDGMRSHRYHITTRYCDLCAPLRPFGGLVGAARWLVASSGALLAGVLIYFELLR